MNEIIQIILSIILIAIMWIIFLILVYESGVGVTW